MRSNFNKFPVVRIKGHTCITGWQNITDALQHSISKKQLKKSVIAVECYHGVDINELQAALLRSFPAAELIDAASALKSPDAIEKMVYPFVTDDPVFGYMSPLSISDFFDGDVVLVSPSFTH